jgi:hypothetical protein
MMPPGRQGRRATGVGCERGFVARGDLEERCKRVLELFRRGDGARAGTHETGGHACPSRRAVEDQESIPKDVRGAVPCADALEVPADPSPGHPLLIPQFHNPLVGEHARVPVVARPREASASKSRTPRRRRRDALRERGPGPNWLASRRGDENEEWRPAHVLVEGRPELRDPFEVAQASGRRPRRGRLGAGGAEQKHNPERQRSESRRQFPPAPSVGCGLYGRLPACRWRLPSLAFGTSAPAYVRARATPAATEATPAGRWELATVPTTMEMAQRKAEVDVIGSNPAFAAS